MSEGESLKPNVTPWRVAAVLWMALIFLLSSSLFAPKMSFDTTLDWFGVFNYFVRKCAHATEFGILTWLLFRSFYPTPVAVDRAKLWSAIVALIYAASDEYHQSFVPLRSGKASDVLFDAAGIAIVLFLIRYLENAPTSRLRDLIFGGHPEAH